MQFFLKSRLFKHLRLALCRLSAEKKFNVANLQQNWVVLEMF